VYGALVQSTFRHPDMSAKSWRFLASYLTLTVHHNLAAVPLRPHHNVPRDSRYAVYIYSRLLRSATYGFNLETRQFVPDMPPQIKQDLNRSGWETTDFPSVCEKCLPDNPYVQMLKEDHGAVSLNMDPGSARTGGDRHGTLQVGELQQLMRWHSTLAYWFEDL
jgi:hypothetical protein